jgi:Cdc6-like AAA superfamily ATPase
MSAKPLESTPVNLGTAQSTFTPGSPIILKDLFAGRLDQINRVIECIGSPGVHPVIFGRRGVGKTSLANVIHEVLDQSLTSLKITCSSEHDFGGIWRGVLRRANINVLKDGFGFSREQTAATASLATLLPQDDVTVDDVYQLLERLGGLFFFTLDEFDRVEDARTQAQIADLIKLVSDNLRGIKICIVGVGDSVHELVKQHESVVRNLRQIEMPPMQPEEIQDILKKGFERCGVVASADIYSEAIRLADGYPHYAHLLGLSICRILHADSANLVTTSVFNRACASAVDDAIETLKATYAKAVATAKKSNYPKVLVACAFARHDDRGVFRATDVVDAANKLFAEEYSIQNVVPALGVFASEQRGPVLETIEVSGRNQYRFRDPMMKPFLKLKSKDLTGVK